MIIPTGYYFVGGNIETGHVISDNSADHNKGLNAETTGNTYKWIIEEKSNSSKYANSEIAKSIATYGGYFIDTRYADAIDKVTTANAYGDIYSGTQYADIAICKRMEIWNATDLVYFRDDVDKGYNYKDKTVNLMADIDLSTVCSSSLGSWNSIGKYNGESASDNITFEGTFKGNNHTIKNIYMYSTEQIGIGLFAHSSGTIEGVTITGNITGSRYIGGIAGTNTGGTIKNCVNKCDINGVTNATSQTGGITGLNDINGTVENCVNEGTITGTGQQVGGIVGYNSNNAYVKNCANKGAVTGSGNYTGGIVGMNGYTTNSFSGYIENCYNIATVKGAAYVGGICGNNYYKSKISNSYNIGTVSGTSEVGAISGRFVDTSTISNCYYLLGTATYGIGTTSSDEGAEPRAQVYMKTTPFINDLGDSNWKFVSGKNDGYPILQWEEGTEIAVAANHTEKSYIKSDGIQYIDTGIVPNQNIGIDIEFLSYDKIDTSSGYGSIGGARTGSKNKEFQITTYAYNSTSGGTLRFGANEYSLGLTSNTKSTIKIRKNKLTNAKNSTASLATTAFTSPCNFTLFALNQNGTISQNGTLELYYCKLWSSYSLKRYFVPIYNSSTGKAGLFDIVNGVYYYDKNGGTFETN